MKFKRSNLLIVVSLGMVVIMVACMVFGLSFLSKGTQPMQTCYTVCEDGDYYSETTYYYDENEYFNSVKYRANSNGGEANATFATAVQSDMLNPNENFIMGIRKGVWVEETQDYNGLTLESRLLNKNEVADLKKYEEELNCIQTITNGMSDISAMYASDQSVGSDITKWHYLGIELMVTFFTDTEIYMASGYATWEEKLVWAWDNDKAAEEEVEDYICLTWKEDSLCCDSNLTGGRYYNGTAVQFGKEISNDYGGYVWKFYEKSGLFGKEMEIGAGRVMLKRFKELQNDETSIRFTYIHTWNKIKCKPTLTAGTDGLAMSVEMSVTENNWQIEVSVPHLKY